MGWKDGGLRDKGSAHRTEQPSLDLVGWLVGRRAGLGGADYRADWHLYGVGWSAPFEAGERIECADGAGGKVGG